MKKFIVIIAARLNPCFSGICSLRCQLGVVCMIKLRLNPCFSGICSLSSNALAKDLESLNPCFSGICSLSKSGACYIKKISVLILVLVEYAL